MSSYTSNFEIKTIFFFKPGKMRAKKLTSQFVLEPKEIFRTRGVKNQKIIINRNLTFDFFKQIFGHE